MNIAEEVGDIWRRRKVEIVMFFLFFTATTAAFALGYIYATQYEPIPIVIEKCSEL